MKKFLAALAVYTIALYGIGTMLLPATASAATWLFCHAPDYQYPYKHWHKQNGVHTDYKCRPTDNIGWWYYINPPW